MREVYRALQSFLVHYLSLGFGVLGQIGGPRMARALIDFGVCDIICMDGDRMMRDTFRSSSPS